MADLSIEYNQASVNYRDLKLVNNDLVLTKDENPDGTNPVLQDIIQRLSFYSGEWFMDLTKGIPYYQQILIKNPDQSKIDAIFLNTILKTNGVIQVTSYKFEPDFKSRLLKISFVALTTKGKVDYSGSIQVGA